MQRLRTVLVQTGLDALLSRVLISGLWVWLRLFVRGLERKQITNSFALHLLRVAFVMFPRLKFVQDGGDGKVNSIADNCCAAALEKIWPASYDMFEQDLLFRAQIARQRKRTSNLGKLSLPFALISG